MYDEILEIAENRAYLNAVKRETFGPNLEILESMPKYEDLKDLEEELRKDGKLKFDVIFDEPTGYYLMKCFLVADYSVDKAVFLKDVDLYRKMRDPSARLKIARLIYDRFVGDEDESKFPKGESVFDRRKKKKNKKVGVRAPEIDEKDPLGLLDKEDDEREDSDFALELRIGKTNAIGIYSPSIAEVKEKLDAGEAPASLFNDVAQEVITDLRMDVFPRFEKSPFYQTYIRTKSLETGRVSHKDFVNLKMLGKGAFGAVSACIKKDTGKLYASKCISKRAVAHQNSVDSVVSERNVLCLMDSDFVCCLKYAVQDSENLYLILDLLTGGDLKNLLNKEEKFSEVKSRFYAAQVLLGLEHIHSKGVIYRDIKLENVLLDDKGNCKVCDVGLAVITKGKVKGYAGTPGYTAPEVILMQAYDKNCDFFSFGVLVYRFLSGIKPFGSHMGSSDLDKNVVSVDPHFPEEYFTPESVDLLSKLMIKDPTKRLGSRGIEEIKQHPWFDPIDWGLLEAGYVDPPFIPRVEEITPDSLKATARPMDEKLRKIKLTDEFQRSLESFNFKSVRALQRELVDCMEKAHENINFEKYSRRSSAPPEEVKKETPDVKEKTCHLM